MLFFSGQTVFHGKPSVNCPHFDLVHFFGFLMKLCLFMICGRPWGGKKPGSERIPRSQVAADAEPGPFLNFSKLSA